MSYSEDKKPLPPYAGPPADPELESDIKDLTAHHKKLKTGLLVGAVFLVFLVIGATLLGVYLSEDSRLVTSNRKLKHEGETLQEKVEVDVNLKTETFYTKSQDGEAAIMYDTQNELAATKFSGLHICFITEDSTYSEDGVEDMADQCEKDSEDEDKVGESETGPAMNLTIDETRGKVDKSVLTQKMLDFCKHHEIYWAVSRQTAPATASGGDVNSRQKRGICRRYRCYWYYYYRYGWLYRRVICVFIGYVYC